MLLGYWKPPLSRRLYNSKKPSPSPVQRLEPIAPSSAEQKQRPLKRVHLKLALYQVCQPVNAPPQVCVSAGNVHRVVAVEIIQYDFAAGRIASSVASSAPA